MMNEFVQKKMIAFVVTALMPSMVFFIVLTNWGLLFATLGLVLSAIAAIRFGTWFMKNPFYDAIEGNAMLVADVNSSGIIRLFGVRLDGRFIRGQFMGKTVETKYDRTSSFYLDPNVSSAEVDTDEKGRIVVKLNNDDFNAARFRMAHIPFYMFNSQLGHFVSKDFLSSKEKLYFAEQGIMTLAEQLKQDRQRFVEAMHQIPNIWKWASNQGEGSNNWILFVIIGFIVIMLLFFFKDPLMNIISGLGGAAGNVAGDLGNIPQTVTNNG